MAADIKAQRLDPPKLLGPRLSSTRFTATRFATSSASRILRPVNSNPPTATQKTRTGIEIEPRARRDMAPPQLGCKLLPPPTTATNPAAAVEKRKNSNIDEDDEDNDDPFTGTQKVEPPRFKRHRPATATCERLARELRRREREVEDRALRNQGQRRRREEQQQQQQDLQSFVRSAQGQFVARMREQQQDVERRRSSCAAGPAAFGDFIHNEVSNLLVERVSSLERT